MIFFYFKIWDIAIHLTTEFQMKALSCFKRRDNSIDSFLLKDLLGLKLNPKERKIID